MRLVISIPAWVATAILGFLLMQFGGAVLWAIHADRRLALMEQSLASIAKQLSDNNLAVMSQRLARVEQESGEHKMAHGRNRDRIETLRSEMLDLHAVRSTPHRENSQ